MKIKKIVTLLIWAVCFAMITISASLTHDWYKNRGPEIHISFQSVSGLIPGESKIMYRGVQVGTVKKIRLETFDNVVVIAKMTKQIEKFLGKDTRFWIVKPEFGLEKISNLSAITTGDYIEVDPVKGQLAKEFQALPQPPATVHPKLDSGLKLILKSSSLNGVTEDSPILYKGFQIGNIWQMELSKDKRYVDLTIFIYEEYSDVVRKNSYFSNISGFHADIHLFGASMIGLDSLRTLLRGGIEISTPNFNAPPARNGDVFKVMSTEEALALQER